MTESLFACPRRVLRLSRQLLVAGVLLLTSGAALAYGELAPLSIGQLIGAHVLIVLGPTLFKLGYVIRLAALERIASERQPTNDH